MPYLGKGKCQFVSIHDMKAVGTAELQFHSFLTSVLDEGEMLTLRSGLINPGKKPWNPLNGWSLKSVWKFC